MGSAQQMTTPILPAASCDRAILEVVAAVGQALGAGRTGVRQDRAPSA